MDRASIEKTLGWMKPPVGRRVQGRRIKVYVESLRMNFYLKNPSGRRLSTATLMGLAYDGITTGWSQGAEGWPRDVHLLQINLMRLAQSQRTTSDLNGRARVAASIAQFNRDYVEMQLAHSNGCVGGIYLSYPVMVCFPIN